MATSWYSPNTEEEQYNCDKQIRISCLKYQIFLLSIFFNNNNSCLRTFRIILLCIANRWPVKESWLFSKTLAWNTQVFPLVFSSLNPIIPSGSRFMSIVHRPVYIHVDSLYSKRSQSILCYRTIIRLSHYIMHVSLKKLFVIWCPKMDRLGNGIRQYAILVILSYLDDWKWVDSSGYSLSEHIEVAFTCSVPLSASFLCVSPVEPVGSSNWKGNPTYIKLLLTRGP